MINKIELNLGKEENYQLYERDWGPWRDIPSSLEICDQCKKLAPLDYWLGEAKRPLNQVAKFCTKDCYWNWIEIKKQLWLKTK
ncbi:MAG: hypothetical protein ACHQVS_00645 [Candidatus Babeliales bacterium]